MSDGQALVMAILLAFAIAAVLESPQWAAEQNWTQNALGRDWYYWGNIDGRADVDRLNQEMQQHPVALLIGVRAHAVPERGTLRLLEQLAQSAQGGIWVKLLPETNSATDSNNRTSQWQNALSALNIPLIEIEPKS